MSVHWESMKHSATSTRQQEVRAGVMLQAATMPLKWVR